MSGYAVVLLMSSPCPEDESTRCVQSVILGRDGLPFPTRDDALAVANTYPDWTTPHLILVKASDC